jgi:peroxiredoxin family protein
MPPELPPATLGLLLISGTHERAHYAFVMAAAAAALGRPAVLFATNHGCRALCRDWSALDGAASDAGFRARGVAAFDELREAAVELGVRLLACDAGLRIAGIDAAALLPDVTVAGVATFLAETAGGQLLSL